MEVEKPLKAFFMPPCTKYKRIQEAVISSRRYIQKIFRNAEKYINEILNKCRETIKKC